MLLVFNRSAALCAIFIILNAYSSSAKTLRNAERKLGARNLMFGADALQANVELENHWKNFAVQEQMSIPTTMAPVAPTAPPTAPPTPTPPPTTEGETAPPTVAATPNPTRAPVLDPTPPPTNPPTQRLTPNPTTPGPASLFLDEDDVFDEFSLVECQGGEYTSKRIIRLIRVRLTLCDLTRL